ncbi:hypothetical protein F4774DRAFT_410311 [Daldinia eschscholtzii]|nr:hypothetical protein F4774DRAFT_410311 [Daldinia eschscholtzii]
MYRTYYLDYRDYERNTFGADELVIRPIPVSVETIEPPPASTPVFYVDVYREKLDIRRQRDRGSHQIASAYYHAKGGEIEIKVGENRTRLIHSHAQTGTEGQPHHAHMWNGHSRRIHTATLPDGTKLVWEPVGHEGHRESVEKSRIQADKVQPRLRCVQEGSTRVLGEMMKSNDVVRLMTDDDFSGEGATLGLYVLLGFVSLYERARARDRSLRKPRFFRRKKLPPSLTGKATANDLVKGPNGMPTDKQGTIASGVGNSLNDISSHSGGGDSGAAGDGGD